MKGAISPIRDAWNVQGSAAPARTAGHAIETVFVCGLRASEWLFRLVGLERPQWSFWPRASGKKWGRSSPTQCFARVQIKCWATRNL